MRITAIRATVVQERVLWAREVEDLVTIAPLDQRKRDQPARRLPILGSLLVEIECDEGLVGLGLGGGGWPGAFVAREYLRPLLLGRDPSDIQALWESMYRATFRYGQAGIVLMAMSGIDLALWDLKGKALGQPVWKLLGGKARADVPVYATLRDPVWARSHGFYGVKLGAPYGPADGHEGMAKNESYVATVRDRIGPEIEIMIDCSRTWTIEYTLEMARKLSPYRIAFIEEPISSQDIEGYVRLRASRDMPLLACGEHVYTRYAARALLERGAIDIIQPDIRWTGGLSETLRICDVAAEYDVPAMPHRGSMAWSLHLIMAHEGCPAAEGLVLTDEEAAYSLFDGEPVPVGGRLTVSDAPGFGLTIRPERLEQLRLEAPTL